MKKGSFFNSIKTKVILTMILLVTIPLVIVTVVSALNFMKKGTEDTVTINEAQAHIVEQSIQAVLDQNMRALEVLAKAPSTIAFVSGYEAQKDDILDQMKQIDENMADGNSTVITNSEGKQMLRTIGDCVDISDREYFQKAMEGSEFVSDIQVSKTTGSRISTFAVPVRDTEGEVIGIVQRNYDLSGFHEQLANELIEDRQELLIVDRTGSVIAHSGHEIDPNEPEDQSGNPFYTDSRGEKMSDSYETKWQKDTWMVSWVKEEHSGWVVASCRVQSVALRAVSTTSLIMIIIGVVFLIAGIVVAVLMSKSFTAPIKEINESLGALADGKFVRISKYEGRKDEFGDIIKETNDVISKLKEIVSHIKKSAESVNTSSEQLATTTGQITKTAEDVSSAVQEIASGATQQADEIQEALENTAVISNNIQKVSNNADDVNQIATEMNQDSTESAGQLERLKTSAGEMGEAILEISEKIGATEDAVERISTKVEAIDSIASQTNLLALNASIEAARAGEVGRGFAVVAEEIGQLADESSNAADEIRAEMDLLLKESQSAVAMAKKVNTTTEVEQKSIIEDTVASIDKLIKGIESSVNGIESITVSAKSCEESRAVVVDSMNDLSAISEENAAASEETAASMQELGAIVTSLAEDANSLKNISNALLEDMKFFQD